MWEDLQSDIGRGVHTGREDCRAIFAICHDRYDQSPFKDKIPPVAFLVPVSPPHYGLRFTTLKKTNFADQTDAKQCLTYSENLKDTPGGA